MEDAVDLPMLCVHGRLSEPSDAPLYIVFEKQINFLQAHILDSVSIK